MTFDPKAMHARHKEIPTPTQNPLNGLATITALPLIGSDDVDADVACCVGARGRLEVW